jgi:hypothetical protein
MKSNFCAVAAFMFLALAARAQTTAFTYQGQLNSNNVPITGVYDLQFKIYNGNNAVVGKWLTNSLVGITNGLFTTTVDFGAGVFDGSTRSLEIGVRTNGNATNAFIVLLPRQPLNSAPYAIQSLNASNAVTLTAPLQATNMVGTIPNSLLSPNVAVLTNNVIFSGNVTATNFTGNGYGLSNVPAARLAGTLLDAQLSANVALQSNPNLNFAGSVAATNFSGGGHGLTNVPGAFFWVVVTNNNTAAQPNIGYICTNDTAPMTITLPSSPAVGDVYKVAAVGAGGWKILQNANQMIAAGNLSDSIGESWTARDSIRVWSAVASSADGTKLVATVKGGLVYTSTNSGVTWASQDSGRNWSSVASSADGTKLVAGAGDNAGLYDYIYTSGNSGVGSWSSHDSQRQWVSVASSAGGTNLVAAVYGTAPSGNGNPGIYTSINSGLNWSQRKAVQYCSSVASSADGTKLVATVNTGQIWTSTDSGNTWVARDSSRSWTAVASSADGSRLLAAVSSGALYVSYNFGTNWAAVNSGSTATWTGVASSADGSRLAAVDSSGDVYISTDSGVTWAQRFGGLPATAAWTGVACSADGGKLVLVANNNQIYTSSQGGTTPGVTGYLFGPQHSAIELIYAATNLFLPLSHEGTIRVY